MAVNKNLLSLGLLRNGKVYQTKELAYQGLVQSKTNDGVAKLARYLYSELGGEPIIRTLVGFYANAAEMEDAGGGQSYYTVLDIEGSAGEVEEIKEAISGINETIGSGIDGTTLTDAINDINDKLGSGFTSEHTVAEALEELEDALTDALAISLDVASAATSGYLKTYILSQGETEIGRIDIPKDLVVESGSLVHGTWSGDTFTEDPDGPDAAIKLVIANQENPIYINTKDLVDYYTAGNGIDIDNTHNVISLKYNNHSEEFLVVDEDGIRVEGIQAAIDDAINKAALEASDGISIAAGKVKAVAASYSAPAVKNPISVDKEGIKFASQLDCGFFDDETVVADDAAAINAIETPAEADVFINGEEALGAASGKTFKNLEVSGVEAASQVSLAANESIELDNVDVTGNKGSSNAFIALSSPSIEVSNATVADGAKPYNVFEQVGTTAIDEFNANNINVDDVSLKHNVFNIYRANNDAVINISDGNFNMDVNNSNVIRLANYTNATGVTVNFENINWSYEDTPNKESADWDWAGIIIYQPAGADVALSGDLSKLQTWTFNFKNCKYNGKAVTANNSGEHNQVFYLYNIGGSGTVSDPVAEGLKVNFA